MVQTIGVISQKQLKIEVKLLLSAHRKYATSIDTTTNDLSYLEWPFYGSSVPSVWEGRANC